MGQALIPKTATSQFETGLYTEAFAAVLAEHSAPAPISVPVQVRHPVRARQRSSSDDWRQIAALGWLLLLSTGAASWYAIVDPVWSTPITIPSLVTSSPHIRLTSMPDSRFIQGGMPITGAVRAGAGADELVLATIDPILLKPAEMGVETAALSTPATLAPAQTTHSPARDLVALAIEPSLSAPPSSYQLPNDIIGVRADDDLEKPVAIRNGEVKGPIRNPFVDLYPQEPQRGWPNISTASFARTGKAQSEDPQSDSSSADVPDAKGDARSHAGSQESHPGGGAPGGSSEGKKDSKSDKAAHDSDGPASAGPKGRGDAGSGGSATAGGKGPKAGKDKPSAGKSAPGGPQDNHNSNRGGPSPGKADQNSKSDTDKKDKDKGKDKDKDKDKAGKDKGDKAKGTH
jgi:hypothetical protein